MLLPQYFYNIAAGLESLLSVTFVPFFFKEAERKIGEDGTSKKARERSRGEKVGRQISKVNFP